jgi:hypothetical protein
MQLTEAALASMPPFVSHSAPRNSLSEMAFDHLFAAIKR